MEKIYNIDSGINFKTSKNHILTFCDKIKTLKNYKNIKQMIDDEKIIPFELVTTKKIDKNVRNNFESDKIKGIYHRTLKKIFIPFDSDDSPEQIKNIINHELIHYQAENEKEKFVELYLDFLIKWYIRFYSQYFNITNIKDKECANDESSKLVNNLLERKTSMNKTIKSILIFIRNLKNNSECDLNNEEILNKYKLLIKYIGTMLNPKKNRHKMIENKKIFRDIYETILKTHDDLTGDVNRSLFGQELYSPDEIIAYRYNMDIRKKDKKKLDKNNKLHKILKKYI